MVTRLARLLKMRIGLSDSSCSSVAMFFSSDAPRVRAAARGWAGPVSSESSESSSTDRFSWSSASAGASASEASTDSFFGVDADLVEFELGLFAVSLSLLDDV